MYSFALSAFGQEFTNPFTTVGAVSYQPQFEIQSEGGWSVETHTLTVDNIRIRAGATVVPESGAVILLGVGLSMLGAVIVRRRK